MTTDDEHDERELREAEALARALARGTSTEELPEDALKTAALIRYSHDGGELAKDREEALLPDLLAAAERAAARRESAAPIPWWRWIAAFAGVGAAVAIVLLVVLGGSGRIEPTALPAPDPSLLSAQLARLEDEGADRRFDAEMRAYRGDVYAALGERYGAR